MGQFVIQRFHPLDQLRKRLPRDDEEGIRSDTETEENGPSSPFSSKTEDGAASSRAVPCIVPPSSCSWGNGTSQFGHEMRGRSPGIDWMHASSIYHVLSSALRIF